MRAFASVPLAWKIVPVLSLIGTSMTGNNWERLVMTGQPFVQGHKVVALQNDIRREFAKTRCRESLPLRFHFCRFGKWAIS
jgi:hypothetical protein